MMTGVGWRIRPFAAAADRAWVRLLWQAAMPPSWPVLPAGIGQLGEGLIAQAGHARVGFAALDTAGSIPLILVEPGYQRRGIGAGPLEAAQQQVRAGTASSLTAGSGGAVYIWPGVPVPCDLPAAEIFFASRGWRRTHDTLDLVTDPAGYRLPPGAAERAARTGVTITRAAGDDLAAVRAFEAAAFPSWAPWFAAARPEHVLLARTRPGSIAGTCCCWRAPARTPCSRRCSAGPRGPSAASASPRRCTDRGSGRPWSCAPPRSSARPVSAPATSAGPPASRSTAAPDIGPGGVTPCTPARPDLQFADTPLHDPPPRAPSGAWRFVRSCLGCSWPGS